MNSRRLNLGTGERIHLLKSQPAIGISTGISYIETIFMEHYSIFYKIKIPKPFIIGFWDNRQDPEKLFEFLEKQPR